MAFELRSDAFRDGGEIPRRFTGEGDDVSPRLSWTGAPEGTKSFALIVDDPDAPDPAAPVRTWVHWIVANLPATATELPEAVGREHLHRGVVFGTNDWTRTTYGGPMPPIGRHRYFFRLYALDTVLPGLIAPRKKELERAMRGHVLAQATLMGTYEAAEREPLHPH